MNFTHVCFICGGAGEFEYDGEMYPCGCGERD